MKGFTLIELIVAIAIIAVLSTAIIAAVDPLSQFQKANDARRKSDLSQVQKVLEQYYQDNGVYPASDSSYRMKALDGSVVDWGSAWSPYMNLLPKDPSSTENYVYYSQNGQSYWIYSSLERGSKDLQACTSGSECSSIGDNSIAPLSCGGPCNFGLSSPNVAVDTAVPAPTSTPIPVSTSTPTPVPTSTPTPTPSQTCTSNAYEDEDGDGYTVGPLSLCYTGSPPAGWTLTPSAQADCYDKNSSANPGQNQYFTATRGTSGQGNDAVGNTWNSYDYNCDNQQSMQYSTFYSSTPADCGSCGGACQSSGASCGGQGYVSCTVGIGWEDGGCDPSANGSQCSPARWDYAKLSSYATNGCR